MERSWFFSLLLGKVNLPRKLFDNESLFKQVITISICYNSCLIYQYRLFFYGFHFFCLLVMKIHFFKKWFIIKNHFSLHVFTKILKNLFSYFYFSLWKVEECCFNNGDIKEKICSYYLWIILFSEIGPTKKYGFHYFHMWKISKNFTLSS